MARRNVRSRVTLYEQNIKKMEKAQIRALEKTAESLHTEIVQSKIMPRDTGALQNEKTSVDTTYSKAGIVSINSEGPYARRLYYHPEYHFQTYKNAFAQARWFDPWLPGGISEDFAKDEFAKLLRREMRNI